MAEYLIRLATEDDFKIIRSLVRSARINPTGLDWSRFLVAVTSSGEVVGCGQVKPRGRDLLEIASIAVIPDHQSNGIASSIIQQLIDDHPMPLYLMCRSSLEGFYRKFGFFPLARHEMPPYYRRIATFVGMIYGFQSGKETLFIMKRD